MGLKNTIAKAVGAAFAAVGDLKETVTYVEVVGNGEYDSASDTNSQDEVVHSAISFIFMDYTITEHKSDAIRDSDMKAMVQQSELPCTPDAGDRIIREDGLTWRVIKKLEDPAHATWELQVRHGQ